MSTAVETFYAALMSDFRAYWNNAAPVAWPNVYFDPDGLDEFVEVRTQHVDGGAIGIGDVPLLQSGVFSVISRTAQNSGLERCYELAERVYQFIVRRDDATEYYQFRDPYIAERGVEAGWFQIEAGGTFSFLT